MLEAVLSFVFRKGEAVCGLSGARREGKKKKGGKDPPPFLSAQGKRTQGTETSYSFGPRREGWEKKKGGKGSGGAVSRRKKRVKEEFF